MLLHILLASVASLPAQTLKSSSVDDTGTSNSLTSMQPNSSAPSSFGSVNQGVTLAVESGVADYSASLSADSSSQFTGVLLSSGGGGKAQSNSSKLAAMKANSPGSSSGSLRSEILSRAAELMQAGYAPPVLSSPYTTILSAKTAYSPSILPATGEKELSENMQSAEDQLALNPRSTEYQSAFEGFGASFNSLEKIGEPLQSDLDSTGTGFNAREKLCGQSCGLGGSSSRQGKVNTETAKKSQTARQSAATNLRKRSLLDTDFTSDQLPGLQTGGSSIKIGTFQGERIGGGGALDAGSETIRRPAD